MIDESDQAALCGSIFQLHIDSHGGKIDPNCEFCKGFLMEKPIMREEGYPLESYKFVIFDVSEFNR